MSSNFFLSCLVSPPSLSLTLPLVLLHLPRSRVAKTVEQHRQKNLARSTKDGAKIIEAWTHKVRQTKHANGVEEKGEDKFLMGANKSWSWALL